ncbi:MAG: DUF429 domain-containing protein [Candidatus Aenigmatarchaeota archaeon]
MHRKLIFCGIDLAGSEKRISGFAIMNKKFEVKTFSLFSDKEILEKIDKYKPIVIAIDAPLSLPKGRRDINEKNNIHFRKCDLELRKYKIKFFPITLGPMRMLTLRGIKLKNELEKLGYKVIETFPGAFYDIFGIPRKEKDKILNFLKEYVSFENEIKNLHELDATVCALIAYMHFKGLTEELGDVSEGTLIIPKKYVQIHSI